MKNRVPGNSYLLQPAVVGGIAAVAGDRHVQPVIEQVEAAVDAFLDRIEDVLHGPAGLLGSSREVERVNRAVAPAT